MKYVPLFNRTHFSLLKSPTKPDKLIESLKESGFTAGGVCDYHSIGGLVQTYKACKEKGVKPILGIDLNVDGGQLFLLAKNLNGWKALMKLSSIANHPENFDVIPHLSLSKLSEHAKDLVCVTGDLRSKLIQEVSPSPYSAYLTKLELSDDWMGKAKSHLDVLKAIFKSDLYLGINTSDSLLPANSALAGMLRDLGRNCGIKCVAAPSSHYLEPEHYIDQRVLICTELQVRLNEAVNKFNEKTIWQRPFFNSDKYHLIKQEEIAELGFLESELSNTLEINEKIESYKITQNPKAPQIDIPGGLTADEYLRELCRDGWKRKIKGKIGATEEPKYVDRIKYELEVLQGAGLSSYFLVVNDIIKYMIRENITTPVGRGSAAGCLVSYLIDITKLNPIPYGLIFERFYNAGRNTKDKVSMPDVDLDVPSNKRDQIIGYLKTRYGENRVAQICTFQSIKGRAALKEVLRCFGGVPFEVMNKITENIEDESKIADELQEMKEEEGESSLIKWALENRSEALKEWATLEDDGSIVGPLSKRFEQAIRLEGVKKAYSKHAGGVVISHIDLDEAFPMILNKSGEGLIVGVDMHDVEDLGGLKFDILGVKEVDILDTFQSLCKKGPY